MWFASPRQKIRKRLSQTPRVPLGQVQEGPLARVVGRAGKLDEVLEAPVSGRPCLYYELTIVQASEIAHRKLAREERAVMFSLEDATGHAIIDPSRCIVDLEEDGTRRSLAGGVTDPRQTALLKQFGIAPRGLLQFLLPGLVGDHFVFREAIIEVGETIAILGSAVREPDPDATPDASYRGAPPTRVRMTSARNQPMIISDHPSTTR